MIGLKSGFPRALCSVLLVASQLPRGLIGLGEDAFPLNHIERTLSGDSSRISSLHSNNLDIPKLAHDFDDEGQSGAPKEEIPEEMLQPDDCLSPQNHSRGQGKDNISCPKNAQPTRLMENQRDVDIRKLGLDVPISADIKKQEADSMGATASAPDLKSGKAWASKQGAGEVLPSPESSSSSDGEPVGSSHSSQNTRNEDVQLGGDQLQHHVASSGCPVGQGVAGHSTPKNLLTPILDQPVPRSHSQLSPDAQAYHSDLNLQNHQLSYHPIVTDQSPVQWQLFWIDRVVPTTIYQVHRSLGYLPVRQDGAVLSAIPSIHESYAHVPSSHSVHQRYVGESSTNTPQASSQTRNSSDFGSFRSNKPPKRFVPPRMWRKNKKARQQSSTPYFKIKNQTHSVVNRNKKLEDGNFTLKSWRPESVCTPNEPNQAPSASQKVENCQLDDSTLKSQQDLISSMKEPFCRDFDEIVPTNPAEDAETYFLTDGLDTSSPATPRPNLDSKKHEEHFDQASQVQPKSPQYVDTKHEGFANQTPGNMKEEIEPEPSAPVSEVRSSAIKDPKHSSHGTQVREITPSLQKTRSIWVKKARQNPNENWKWSKKVQVSTGLPKTQESALDLHISKGTGSTPSGKVAWNSVPDDEGNRDSIESMREDEDQKQAQMTDQQSKQDQMKPYQKPQTQIEISHNGENLENQVVVPNENVKATEESIIATGGTLPNHEKEEPNHDDSSLLKPNKFAALNEIVPDQGNEEQPREVGKQLPQELL
ncbi:hypothetical protein PtA15_10A501 [Puccinia triticina]|uniref:Uncharacterized protein n=1 Tax=Puccinia triticina TaxID=208348 RepID=A0ABY7CUV2_9BASI|nr:uncharacterized protein PtA15_10A501 [Puccinia triticina]WAQ89078.1 hypothetical protein PtA15_10A501 [Puccinia triticina]